MSREGGGHRPLAGGQATHCWGANPTAPAAAEWVPGSLLCSVIPPFSLSGCPYTNTACSLHSLPLCSFSLSPSLTHALTLSCPSSLTHLFFIALYLPVCLSMAVSLCLQDPPSCSMAIYPYLSLLSSFLGVPSLPSNCEVWLGRHNLSESEDEGQLVQVRKSFIHPLYKTKVPRAVIRPGEDRSHDLMLLHLEEPAKITKAVRVMDLPKKEPPLGSTCYVSGWGSTDPETSMLGLDHISWSPDLGVGRRVLRTWTSGPERGGGWGLGSWV